jgi:hypothetical protein
LRFCALEKASRAHSEKNIGGRSPLRPVRVLSLASEGRSGVWGVRSRHGLGTAERRGFRQPSRFHCPHPAWPGSVKTFGRAGVVSRRVYPARAAARPQPTDRMLIASASWRAYRRSNSTRGWNSLKAGRAVLAWALGSLMILRVATAGRIAAATACGQSDGRAFSGASTQVRP